MRLFTVSEANALLPTVRGILKRIQNARKKLAAFQHQAKTAATQAEQGGGGLSEGLLYADLLIDFTSQTSELETLGIQIKDFDRGLVDFPSLRDGRVVLLCWQIGEGDEVEWWHDVEDGFAGRTPI